MVSVGPAEKGLGLDDILAGHKPGIICGVHPPIEKTYAALFHLRPPGRSILGDLLGIRGDLLEPDMDHTFVF